MPPRRRYTAQQKADIIRLVLEEGLTRQQAAIRCAVALCNVARWVQEARLETSQEKKWRVRARHLSGGSRQRRRLRTYSPAQKAELLRAVMQTGLTCAQAARLHGLPRSTVRRWVDEARAKNP